MVRSRRSWQAPGPHRCHRRQASARQAQGRPFTPNVDCGDFVIIVNADKAILTGRKLDEKHYYHHTGWIGNLKEVKYRTLMNERPEFAMEPGCQGHAPQEHHRPRRR